MRYGSIVRGEVGGVGAVTVVCAVRKKSEWNAVRESDRSEIFHIFRGG
jgi:hypothetical protein